MKHAAALVALAAAGTRGAFGLSPVTRVVELLQGLSQKVEEEAKQEEDLYETFVCWGKTVVSQKTQSNQKAASRKESLEQYIADLDAGRIELTTERQDLEKEIAGLTDDIEQAEALRSKEKEDYTAAKAELEQGKAALEKAIAVLDGVDEGGKSALLRVRSSAGIGAGYAQRAAEARSLTLAVDIGRRSLSKGDALFLQRLLEGDVPEKKDWKKLNRKATFKKKYEARSGKIKDTLSRMLQTFTRKLEDVEADEEKAADLHKKLMTAKGDQKDKAEKALESMSVEGAARGLSKSEAQAEIDALKTQIEDDEKFIKQTEDALDKKKEEWKARKEVRTGELEAISKAIAVLHSDDARDLFKRSFSSQGFLFAQKHRAVRTVAKVSAHARASSTSAARRAAAVLRASGSVALGDAVARLGGAAPAHFAKVIEAIDKMIETLGKQEKTDLKNKEACEKARADDTREAIKTSREIDELTETVTRLESEIEELKSQIEEKNAEIKETEEMLKEAKRTREDEHKEWQASDKDDKDAAALIKDAVGVLEDFYKSIALVQRKDPPEVVAGEAPPPPPATWEGGYTGKKDENTGVVAILGLIREDILKDRETAKTAEDDAKAKYETMKKEAEGEIKTLQGEITEMEGTIGKKEGEVEAAETDISDKKSELEVVMKRIKDAQPGCDFVTVNFDTRMKARQVEKDGLVEAKAILSGAKFD